MKKTHRAVLSILLVLTLLATLPLTALAEEPETQLTPVDNNTSENYNPTVNSGEIMSQNTGTVTSNEGTITTNGAAPVEGQSANPNSGTVVENKSGATISDNYGTVKENEKNATITDNYGLVGELQYGSPSDNTAGNYGTVKNNQAGGAVVNREGGIVENNSSTEGSGAYYGVLNYGGTVKSNSGEVYNDRGEVEVNELDGSVFNKSASPEAADGPKVTTNYGTVIYSDPDKPHDSGTPYYGVHFVNDENEMVYLGQYKGAAYPSDSAEEVTIEKLQANCKDYKIIGIQKVEDYNRNTKQFSEHDEAVELNDDETTDAATITRFKISAPTRLTLLWEKITSIFKPAASTASSVGGGAEAVPTSYKPKYIGLGSVIFINEKGYKVVEIKDDAYVVVSFDALSDEDVQDLDALYAKLFTPEQQKLIKNVGQLLDSEDVLAVFGTPGNHPVYEISKDLVK